MKLASPQTVLVLLAGTIPVLTFVVERWVTRRYINPALAAAGSGARGACPPAGPSGQRVSQQYFTEHPAAAHRPGTVHVVMPDVHLELATDSGMFSPSRLDPGTRLLLEEVPPPPAAGHLLDLGCGYGPLALVMAARSPGARVWAVDVNTRRWSCAPPTPSALAWPTSLRPS